MNRNFLRNCFVFGMLGLLILGVAGALWYLFYRGSSGALPVVRLIQPNKNVTLVSGQGLVFIVDAQSDIGIERIDLLVDGQVQKSVSVNGENQFQASMPWFSTRLGDYELSAIGYDRGGRASLPASVMVRVGAVDAQALVQGAESMDVRQGPEDIVVGGAGANQGAGGAPGGQPPADPQPGAPAADPDAADPPADPQPGDPAADPGAADPPEEPQPGDPDADPGAAEPPEPIPGEPPQGDGEPPTAELIVNPGRDGNWFFAQVDIRGHDNVGLDFLQLRIAPPLGEPRRVVKDCNGTLDCADEGSFPLDIAGQWSFILRAFDLSAQASLPDFAMVQVICNDGVDENNQPIIECALAEENIPDPGDVFLPPGAAGGFWRPGERPILIPFDAADQLLCKGIEAPQESFLAGVNCRVVLPVNIPDGPFTNCPGPPLFSLLDADLRRVDLRNANFFQGDLRQADLTCGADLRGADLRLALLNDTKVTASTQLDAKWRLVWELVNRGGYLRDLRGVDLSEAGLFTADLFGATLTDADLHGADLSFANLYAVDLTGADLTGVIWRNTTCPDGSNSDNNGGTCEGALAAPLPRNQSFMIGDCEIVLPVNLPDGPFTDCEQDNLWRSDLRQVDLRNANLFGAVLVVADLRGADLTGADLRWTQLDGAIIDENTRMDEKWRLVWRISTRGARDQDLTGVDLSWAALYRADLSEATLDGADLSHTDFRGSTLEGAQFDGTIWSNTWCPDRTNSDDVGGTCEGHLIPLP